MGSDKDYYCAECGRSGERGALVGNCPVIARRCPMRNKQVDEAGDWMSTPPDPTNPDHCRQGDIECIEAIEAALTPEEFRGFCKGNVLKYTWRERTKGKNESLAKARWYLNRMIGD